MSLVSFCLVNTRLFPSQILHREGLTPPRYREEQQQEEKMTAQPSSLLARYLEDQRYKTDNTLLDAWYINRTFNLYFSPRARSGRRRTDDNDDYAFLDEDEDIEDEDVMGKI